MSKKQKNLDNYKAKFTEKEFLDYINSEWDIEMLEIIQEVIKTRLDTLKGMVDIATKFEVKGFNIGQNK